MDKKKNYSKSNLNMGKPLPNGYMLDKGRSYYWVVNREKNIFEHFCSLKEARSYLRWIINSPKTKKSKTKGHGR